MALDSVVDYGSNVTASSEVPEGEPYVGTQERPRRTGDRRRRGRPRLGLLPRPPCPGRARLLWRVDRQPDRAGAVSADLHRRSAHRAVLRLAQHLRSEEHTSELQSIMRISYAVLCLKKKRKT